MSYRLPFRTVLSNGTTSNGNVNGSVTPETFIYQPMANQVLEINFVSGVFAGTGNISALTDFLVIPGLTNGIDLNLQTMGNQDFRPAVVKNNINLLQFLTTTFQERIIGNDSISTGTIQLVQPVILSGKFNDYYSYIVNDDLTGLDVVNIILAGSIYIG